MRRIGIILLLAPGILCAQALRVGHFAQEVRTVHNAGDVRSVAVGATGTVWAAGAGGIAEFKGAAWTKLAGVGEASLVAAMDDAVWFTSRGALWTERSGVPERVADLPAGAANLAAGRQVLVATSRGLFVLSGHRLVLDAGLAALDRDIRQSAIARDGRIAAAGASGLYLKASGGTWQRVFPKSGNRSWAPDHVRGVAFDSRDRLWFASPQGAGCLDGARWSLYTGAEGLPYDDFTTAAAGEDGVIWFGTRMGAIRFDGKTWEYRAAPRWLPDDEARSIAVDARGDAWIATAKGVAQIARKPATLAEKARFFESEIDRRHRRTPYGYVLEVQLARPGDTSEWTQHDSDNDGLWTAMYGAGECFAAGAGNPDARRRATAAFEALRFLGTVTQGGPHPAPRGFIARSVLPTDGPDPNLHDSPDHDRVMRETRDALWKSLAPRWPRSADGKWYWKTDASSDELDGHYFFYGLYYDLVARTDEEKRAVREHVAAVTDHLLEHNFQMVDHDGKPTRWAVFNPENLNHGIAWWPERGMNSLSVLAYLKVAAHVTGDAKYERAYRKLIDEHAYETNVLIPKSNAGPGSGNQSDDEMIFMNYYGLLRYEQAPELRRRYLVAFHNHWLMEEPELNPLFNFIYAAMSTGEKYTYAFGTRDLTPRGSWLEDSAETLRRFPLDRISWSFRNSHRKDIVPLPWSRDTESGRGYRINGKVVPIDESFVQHWNYDPWRLDGASNARSLADGAAFLLPYYMGVYHKFIAE
jgi:hypothetical protein